MTPTVTKSHLHDEATALGKPTHRLPTVAPRGAARGVGAAGTPARMPEQVPAPDDGAKGVLQAEIALLRAQVAALKSQHEKDTCTIAALRSTLEAQGRCPPCAVTPPALEGSAYRLVNAHVPTEFGAFDVCLFGGDVDAGTSSTRYDRDGEIALIYGGIERLHSEGAATGPGALVRVHSSCFTGDVLSSLR